MGKIDEFIKACYRDDLSKVKKFIEEDKTIVNEVNHYGRHVSKTRKYYTGLIAAATRYNIRIVKEILSTPEVDISVTVEGGQTIFHHGGIFLDVEEKQIFCLYLT